MALAVGTRLGPYEISGSLGAGGMGEVYKARDTRLDRTVAVKVLPPALAHDPAFRARFDREARAISQLSHPHICALYDVGEHQGTSFLVMEHLDGETLAARLDRGALKPDEAVRIAVEGAEADARSDVWAFGCVLYEMLAGTRAFAGRSHASLIANIMHVDPPPIRQRQALVSPVLDHIVRRCLEKDPDARWQSIADVGR